MARSDQLRHPGQAALDEAETLFQTALEQLQKEGGDPADQPALLAMTGGMPPLTTTATLAASMRSQPPAGSNQILSAQASLT